MYRLIATDLDGTLLNSNSNISENNLKPIKKALDMGIKIVLCSGRSYLSIKQFEEELGLINVENYGIGFNGSMIYNCHTRIPMSDLRINNVLAVEILKELKNFDLDIIVYIGDNLIVNNSDNATSYEKISDLNISISDDITDIDKDISKIIVHHESREHLEKVEAYMRNFIKGRCSIFFTHSKYLEFTHIEANKGKALNILAKHLGIDMKNVIAVGDNYNDIEMIKAAGLGIAVKNSEQALKDVADYVTTSCNNEGALKEIIEKFIFNK